MRLPDQRPRLSIFPHLCRVPTLNEEEVAQLLATPPPRPTVPATWTAAPTLPPTNTIVAPPQATPVDIEAREDNRAIVSTPIIVTPISQPDAPTSTPTPTAVPVQPTVAVRTDQLLPAIQPPVSQPTTFSITGSSAYQYNVGIGQLFTFENIQLSGGVRLFLRNPIDSNSFLRTDVKGVLRYKPLGVIQEGEMTHWPFFPGYSSQIGSYDNNKNRIVELDWSADGRQFSFRIDPPPGHDTIHAGVYFWQPIVDPVHGAAYEIIVDCVHDGYQQCHRVDRKGPWHWKTIGVEWSPVRGDNTILLTLHLPDEGRNGLSLAQAVRDPFYANQQQPVIRYDYGYWDPNGQTITVSGRRPDGRAIIGRVNRNLQGEQVILDASARGLWLRDAVTRPNGQIVALGRPGGAGSGAVALYDSGGNRISEFIGNAPPEQVRWFPDRSAVVVTVQGQQFTARVDSRAVTNDSGRTGNPQFGTGNVAAAPIPNAVIIGSEFAPGEQLQVVNQVLNIREQPSTSSRTLGQLRFGDYVAIFAGPHNNEGYRWWRVQTANDIFGWIAGTINGAPTIARP